MKTVETELWAFKSGRLLYKGLLSQDDAVALNESCPLST